MTTSTLPPRISAPPAKAPHRSWWRTAFESLALIIAAVVFLEWFLGFCGVGQQEFLVPDAQIGCRHIPNQLVTWRLEGFSQDRLSSTGLRDVEHSRAKPPAVTRIALLGDSSTEGLQVPLADTYARVLENLLNKERRHKYEVINFACSSYSTGQQLMQFNEEVAAYKPDITVLLYNRGDSIENVRNLAQKSPEPRPYYYLNAQGALETDNTVLESQAAKLKQDPLFAFLQRNSRIYGVFSQANLALSINERLYHRVRSWVFKLLSILHIKNDAPVPPAAYPPQDAWKVTSALIAKLNAACAANHSKLILVAFPNTLGDIDFFMQTDDMARMAKERGFSYLDLTPDFKAHRDPNSLFLQFHFSSQGHAVVADRLFKHMKDAALLPAP